jgi:hypothetical protein
MDVPDFLCDCPVPNCGCAGGMQTYAPFYAALVRLFRPETVFEWGPGLNTAMALDAGARVTAIESSRDWIPKGTHGKFACIWVPENDPRYISTWGESKADLFFVDGRKRADCIRTVYDECKEGAILCLHDAQRKRYFWALNRFDYVHFLDRGFAVASKSNELNRIVKLVKEEVGNARL